MVLRAVATVNDTYVFVCHFSWDDNIRDMSIIDLEWLTEVVQQTGIEFMTSSIDIKKTWCQHH
jgi:hypothetical protein